MPWLDLLQPRYQRSGIQEEFQSKLAIIWTTHMFPGITFNVFFMLNLLIRRHFVWYSAFDDHVLSAQPVIWDFCVSWVPRSILCCPRRTVELPVRPIFHVTFLTTVGDVPKVFRILSVILCPFVLCTRSSSSTCLACGKILLCLWFIYCCRRDFSDLQGEIS